MPLLSHKSFPIALLALADGTVFKGRSIGVAGHTTGEVVFNTSVFAYQEAITDPSSFRQIVAFTYPHIGNCGVNAEDAQSRKVFASGLVIRDLPMIASNFRSEQSLPEYLQANQVVGIANIDTRKLTRHVRESGMQGACIWAFEQGVEPGPEHIQQAIELAKQASAQEFDVAQEVSAANRYPWTQGEWVMGEGFKQLEEPTLNVVVYDLGVKHSLLRMLVQRGCAVTVVPANTSADEVLALQPHGVFLSSGPGDVQNCPYVVDVARALMAKKIPLFGVGLGHQVMAHAVGAKTQKLKAGHHGANHPVKNQETARVHIAAQNHNFAVDAQSLPQNVRVNYLNLFDATVQGLEYLDTPALSFQGYPEGTSDPTDTASLFDRFVQLMRTYKNQGA